MVWIFKQFLTGTVELILKAGVAYLAANARTQEEYLTSCLVIVNFLFIGCATDDNITVKDGDIQKILQDAQTDTIYAQ